MDYEDLIECFGVESLISPLLLVGTFLGAAIIHRGWRNFQQAHAKYTDVVASCGLSGRAIAHRLLAACGLADVAVVRSAGGSHYDPATNEVRLSADHFEGGSLASMAIAAHEVGHAQQAAAGVLVLRLSKQLRLMSFALFGVCIALLLLSVTIWSLAVTGVVIMGICVVAVGLQAGIILPREFDASRRASDLVEKANLISADEHQGFNKLLRSAALTYVSEMAMRGVLLLALGVVTVVTAINIASDPGDEPVAAWEKPSGYVDTSGVVPADPYGPTALEPPMYGESFTFLSIAILQATWLGPVVLLILVLIFSSWASRAHKRWTAGQQAAKRNNTAMSLFMRGKAEKAIREFSKAVRIDPKAAEVYYNRGTVYRSLGRFDEALADFNMAIQLSPGLADAIAARGEIRYARGDNDQALEDFNEAVRRAPECALALACRGYIWLDRQQLDRALDDFQQALASNPNERLAYQGRGQLRASQKDFDGALADIDQAVAMGANDPINYVLRGSLWLAKDDLQRAIADFTAALELDPQHTDALRNRGLARLFNGELDLAIADLDEAIGLSPTDAVAWNNRGTARMKLGDYAQSLTDFQEAMRLDPDLPNPHKNLAWLQATCPQASFRDGSQAVRNAARALELVQWQSAEWLGILAAAHAESGDFDAAVKWQKECIEKSAPDAKEELDERLTLYENAQPFRDVPIVPVAAAAP